LVIEIEGRVREEEEVARLLGFCLNLHKHKTQTQRSVRFQVKKGYLSQISNILYFVEFTLKINKNDLIFYVILKK
jgi:hypothetical protein